ncbi:MAG: alpha/beta fold hydrolase, partial [Deltaproteobacteria bacterium]|nr:alpha/beta fold hydrolase [Deltaproteobacteria bacterium]
MRKLPSIWPTTADTVWQVPTADDWSIAVHVYGDPQARRPAVALFHGALSNSRSFDVDGYGLAPFLRDRGYNAFAVDFRGRGHSLPPSGSTGWTIDDLICQDVPAAVAAIVQRTGVEQVHAIGHSLGGMALFGYLVTDGAGIDRVVTLGASATLDIPPVLRRVVQGLSRFSVIPIAALGERAGFLATWIPHPLWRWCCNPDNVEREPFRLFLTCGFGDIAVRKMLHLARICE